MFRRDFLKMSALTAFTVGSGTFSTRRRSTLSAEEGADDVMSAKYWELWNDDVQREIDDRIERYRKADATIELEDVAPGSTIRVEQRSHSFLFGAHIFNFDQLGSCELNAKYKGTYGSLFNAATVPLFWKTLEPTPGHLRFEPGPEDTEEFWNQCPNPEDQPFWRRPATDPIVDYCESRGVVMNGHPLVWGDRDDHHPAWLPTDPASLPEMERLFEKRIAEIAEHYKDRIARYDVACESSVDYGQKESHYGLMPEDYSFKAFQTADRYFPKTVSLNINDFRLDETYVNQTLDLIRRGCRISVVGTQTHLFNPMSSEQIAQGESIESPDILNDRFALMDRMGRPIHLSEITITAPEDNERGRAIQSVIARNLYRFWFSWPSMMGITWWNTVDGGGVKGEPTKSGIFTRQMEPKPTFTALNRLINEEWKTNLAFQADGNRFEKQIRGFKGRYQITWVDSAGNEQTKEMVI